MSSDTAAKSQLRVISYGGGVQSTALIVLAAQGKIDFQTALFCNVGDDSEHPDTLTYVRDVAAVYAAAHGIELHTLSRHKRDGSVETLMGRLTKEGSRSLPIPVRMSNTGAPGRRACTADFKIAVISKWLKGAGATADLPAVVALGISLDEIHRARTNSGEPVQELVYPLLTLRMDRQDCEAVIRAAGLPVPPKSSCYFCPYHSVATWQRMRHEEPELFDKAVALEVLLNERRVVLGKDPVYFNSRLTPLPLATSANRQADLFEDAGAAPDMCESGHCMV